MSNKFERQPSTESAPAGGKKRETKDYGEETRLKAANMEIAINEAVPSLIEALKGAPEGSAADTMEKKLSELAETIVKKAELSPEQAKKLPDVLAKAMILAARKEGNLDEETKAKIAAVATELSPEIRKNRGLAKSHAKDIIDFNGTTMPGEEYLQARYLDAAVKSFAKESGLDEGTARKMLAAEIDRQSVDEKVDRLMRGEQDPKQAAG